MCVYICMSWSHQPCETEAQSVHPSILHTFVCIHVCKCFKICVYITFLRVQDCTFCLTCYINHLYWHVYMLKLSKIRTHPYILNTLYCGPDGVLIIWVNCIYVCKPITHKRNYSTVVSLLKDHHEGPVKGGLTKEVVSDRGEINMRHTTFVTSRAGLTKEVVLHEGGLSKGALLYIIDSIYIHGLTTKHVLAIGLRIQISSSNYILSIDLQE